MGVGGEGCGSGGWVVEGGWVPALDGGFGGAELGGVDADVADVGEVLVADVVEVVLDWVNVEDDLISADNSWGRVNVWIDGVIC